MAMRRRNNAILLTLAVLVAASLACVINVGGPETPTASIPVSTEAVESLTDLWKGALKSARESGQISLVVNEVQLTSLVALRLQEQSDPFLRNPQVYLRDGQIQVFGTVQRSSLQATASMTLEVGIGPDGIPELSLTSADFGPFPVPVGMLDGISAMLDEAFTGSIGPAATGVRVESITIQDGLMAITGRVR